MKSDKKKNADEITKRKNIILDKECPITLENPCPPFSSFFLQFPKHLHNLLEQISPVGLTSALQSAAASLVYPIPSFDRAFHAVFQKVWVLWRDGSPFWPSHLFPSFFRLRFIKFASISPRLSTSVPPRLNEKFCSIVIGCTSSLISFIWISLMKALFGYWEITYLVSCLRCVVLNVIGVFKVTHWIKMWSNYSKV